jgi:SRSO17 transposase
MDLRDETGTEARFRTYAADLASVLGHADRVRPFEDYCVGLLSAQGRKSVEPLAAVTAPGEPRRSISRCCILWRSPLA